MTQKKSGIKLPPLPKLDVNSPLILSGRQELIRIIGNRLFIVLMIFLVLMVGWSGFVFFGDQQGVGSLPVVLFTGILGGVISLQNRLKTLESEDLLLLTKSTMYVMLAPLVGGFMAVLLYILFISGLLEGDLFPKFDLDDGVEVEKKGIAALFNIHGDGHEAYAKLIFWCFVAGFSERFVTNIIGRFESSATDKLPSSQIDDTDPEVDNGEGSSKQGT